MAQGAVKKAVAGLGGNKLTTAGVRDLRRQGLSANEIQRVSDHASSTGVGAKAMVAKQVAQAAQNQMKSVGGQSSGPGRGGGVIRDAAKRVNDDGKLSLSEMKQLGREGYTDKQVQRIAGKADEVGAGAQKRLARFSGGGGNGDDGNNGGGSGGSGGSGATAQEPAYGTADDKGWLAAELKAIDTFKPDLAPTVYNNYRPASLSGEARNAADEAKDFIDSHRGRWSPTPASLAIDYGSSENDGWTLLRKKEGGQDPWNSYA